MEQLYEYCRIARDILQGEHGVGRVIARPFIGEKGNYTRTSRRHDYSLVPPKTTMLDILMDAGLETRGVGKIKDIFAGKGISASVRTANNGEGIDRTLENMKAEFQGLSFTNLVDYDMVYGHRNDVDGYAKALTYFDERLPELLAALQPEDILMITADHGCDPATPSTDHSREYIPLVMAGAPIRPGANIGTRPCFADIAATILEYFGIKETGTINIENIKTLKEYLLEDEKRAAEVINSVVPERLNTVVPGLLMFDFAVEKIGCKKVYISKLGVREGYLLKKASGK